LKFRCDWREGDEEEFERDGTRDPVEGNGGDDERSGVDGWFEGEELDLVEGEK